MMHPFILTCFAAFSTLLGTIPIFIKIRDKNKLIAAACAFASGVMVCISIFDLIPESLNYLLQNYQGIKLIILIFTFVFIGIITSYILDNVIDSIDKDSLYKVGILSMIVIILHNIPEGIITFIVAKHNIALGIPICIAIAFHNIPEGVSISVPIYYATKSKIKAMFYTFISAISELWGAIITSLFLSKYMSNQIIGSMLSLTAGIMLQIAINKLLPTGYHYHRKLTIIFMIIGIIFMFISLRLNNLIS